MVEPAWRIAGKIQLRLMWSLTVLLLLNSVDRVNVSYGALQMNKEIGLDSSRYGLGVSERANPASAVKLVGADR
jgi:hypothetical protein